MRLPGINCTRNAGRKLVIVQGTAEHYYSFLPALRVQLIPNTAANHTITYTYNCLAIFGLHIITYAICNVCIASVPLICYMII